MFPNILCLPHYDPSKMDPQDDSETLCQESHPMASRNCSALPMEVRWADEHLFWPKTRTHWLNHTQRGAANSTAPAAPPPGAATAERGTEPSEMARLLVFLVAKLAKEQIAGDRLFLAMLELWIMTPFLTRECSAIRSPKIRGSQFLVFFF